MPNHNQIKKTWAVARREFGAYFATPLGAIFIIAFLSINCLAVFYQGRYFEAGQADLRIFFSFLPWIYLFFLPAISMRLWAEERRAGSIELLFSLPIALPAIVLGKYLAALGFALLALFGTLPLWVSVNYLGNPDNGIIFAGYIGAALTAAAYLAIGLCVSARTHSQLSAFILSVLACLLFTAAGAPLVLDLLRELVAPAILETLASFSILTAFQAMAGGVIDARVLIFFISLIAVALAACCLLIDTKLGDKYTRPASIILILILFVSVNLAAGLFLRQARLDLTAQKFFTLNSGTKQILQNINEPIDIEFYFSRELANDFAPLRRYGARVRDMLNEMQGIAGGTLRIKLIDPAPFSPAEDAALARGIIGSPIGAGGSASGEVIYFGAAGLSAQGAVETIPFFADERASYLEYDLARLIQNLASPKKPVLGILSNLPLDTGSGGIAAALAGSSQPFLIYNELADRFQTEFITSEIESIPARFDALLLAHPRPLSEAQAYAIDQYLMRGGRLIAFIDPQSEVSLTAGEDGEPLRGATPQSNLDILMQAWGVKMDSEQIIADPARAQKVAIGNDVRATPQDYIIWLALNGDDVARRDIITAGIDRLHLGTAGALRFVEKSGISHEPLVFSSTEAGFIERGVILQAPPPARLLREYKSAGERLVIAARISGALQSAFTNPPADKKSSAKHLRDATTAPAAPQIILFADSDFFDDRLWVAEQVYQGQRFGVPIADNAKFLLNAAEHLLGADELIDLRGRERIDRRFTRVEALRAAAQTRFRTRENELLARVQSAQAALNELERGGAALDATRDAGSQLRHELVEARRGLRQVQAELNRDIETLGAVIFWVNLLAVPSAIILLNMGAVFIRTRRRDNTRTKLRGE